MCLTKRKGVVENTRRCVSEVAYVEDVGEWILSLRRTSGHVMFDHLIRDYVIPSPCALAVRFPWSIFLQLATHGRCAIFTFYPPCEFKIQGPNCYQWISVPTKNSRGKQSNAIYIQEAVQNVWPMRRHSFSVTFRVATAPYVKISMLANLAKNIMSLKFAPLLNHPSDFGHPGESFHPIVPLILSWSCFGVPLLSFFSLNLLQPAL